MKKLFSALAAIAAFSLATTAAHASENAVKGNGTAGNTVSYAYTNARWLHLTPGSSTMTMANGAVVSLYVNAADIVALKQSTLFQSLFTNVSGDDYFNPGDAQYVYCSGGQTYIISPTNTQYVSDNCAAANALFAASK